MNCPACDYQLSEFEMGGVKVDACHGGCGGIWFDAFELPRVDEDREVPRQHLLRVERDPRRVVDLGRKRVCPRCDGMKLTRHFSSARRKVEVDDCPNCGGCWLDAGELEQLRAEKAQAEQTAHMQGVTVSMESIRFLYRIRTERNS